MDLHNLHRSRVRSVVRGISCSVIASDPDPGPRNGVHCALSGHWPLVAKRIVQCGSPKSSVSMRCACGGLSGGTMEAISASRRSGMAVHLRDMPKSKPVRQAPAAAPPPRRDWARCFASECFTPANLRPLDFGPESKKEAARRATGLRIQIPDPGMEYIVRWIYTAVERVAPCVVYLAL
jgi:hypothetical protein